MQISEAKLLSAAEVLHVHDGLVVPAYQPAYKWEVNQAELLLNDLLDAEKQDTRFFLGTLLVRVPKGDVRHEVVDGQQRLITLFLIIAAIYECTSDDRLLSTLYMNQKEKVIRIELSPALTSNNCVDSNATFLDGLVRNHKGSQQELSVRTNFKAIKGRLSCESKESLSRLSSHILRHVQFVLVRVDSPEDAYSAFEVLNSLSTPLATHELVRSLLLNKGGDLALSAWQRVESLAGGVPAKDQEKFRCDALEDAWTLTFGRVLSSRAAGQIGRSSFAEARKELKSTDAVNRLCSTLHEIAQHVYDLSVPNARNKPGHNALDILYTTRHFPVGRAFLVAVKARCSGQIPPLIERRLATVAVRARVMNIVVSNMLNQEAHILFQPPEHSPATIEKILSHTRLAPDLADDARFRRTIESYCTDNAEEACYLLKCIELELSSGLRGGGKLRARQRFSKPELETVAAAPNGGRPSDQSRWEAAVKHRQLSNWILDPGEFKTHFALDEHTIRSAGPIDALSQRQKWLAEHSARIWSLTFSDTPRPPAVKRVPGPFG